MSKVHRIATRHDDGIAFTRCGIRCHQPSSAGWFTLPDNTGTNQHSRKRSTSIKIGEAGQTDCVRCFKTS